MIIFAPAKVMNKEATCKQTTTPAFLTKSKHLRSILETHSKEELAKLMKIKAKTLDTTYDYYQNNHDELMAIKAYNGIAYKQVTAFDYDYIKDNVLIISGLYGVLHGTDAIQPYRLDFTMSKFMDQSLYNYWQEDVSDYINELNPSFLLNLASEEFTKLIRKNLTIDTTLIDLKFNEKVNSTNLKKIRGLILNYCIENKVDDYSDLEGVDFPFFTIGNLINSELTIILNN